MILALKIDYFLNRSELNTMQTRKRQYLSHNYSDSSLKDIVVNPASPL